MGDRWYQRGDSANFQCHGLAVGTNFHSNRTEWPVLLRKLRLDKFLAALENRRYRRGDGDDRDVPVQKWQLHIRLADRGTEWQAAAGSSDRHFTASTLDQRRRPGGHDTDRHTAAQSD